MFAIVPILACLAGLFLLALAWLSGHRTLIPAAVKPLWFWIPGLFLLLASPILAMTPSVIQWNSCSNSCTVDDAEVAAQYERCVRSSSESVAKDAAASEELTKAQLDAVVEERLPAIEAQCMTTTTSMCTTACFNAWWDPEMAAIAAESGE